MTGMSSVPDNISRRMTALCFPDSCLLTSTFIQWGHKPQTRAGMYPDTRERHNEGNTSDYMWSILGYSWRPVWPFKQEKVVYYCRLWQITLLHPLSLIFTIRSNASQRDRERDKWLTVKLGKRCSFAVVTYKWQAPLPTTEVPKPCWPSFTWACSKMATGAVNVLSISLTYGKAPHACI